MKQLHDIPGIYPSKVSYATPNDYTVLKVGINEFSDRASSLDTVELENPQTAISILVPQSWP